jgi:hypothetical protein
MEMDLELDSNKKQFMAWSSEMGVVVCANRMAHI